MADYDATDFFTDPAVVNDVQGYLRHLRAQGPVVFEPHHNVAMVLGYDAAMEVFAGQGEVFSSCNAVNGPIPPMPFATDAPDLTAIVAEHRPDMPWGEHLVTYDGDFHMIHRTFLTQLLTHKRLKANADYVSGLIDRLITSLIDRGGCEITRDFAHALSTLVICDLLGVPEGDRDDLIRILGAPPTQMEEGANLAEKSFADPLTHLHERFRGYMAERLVHPRDDMLTALAQSRFKDGSAPDLATLVRLACFLFGAGQDTSARLVAFSFKILGDFPEVQARVRADPDKLIPEFIEEALRYDNPVKTLSRLALKPATIGGVDIPAGTVVTINIGGANRDPAHFADPDAFDLDRPNKRDHIAFSKGAHGCLGAPLARMEARLTLEKFLARTSGIRVSEPRHGPREARRYEYEPTYLLNGLRELWVEWDKA